MQLRKSNFYEFQYLRNTFTDATCISYALASIRSEILPGERDIQDKIGIRRCESGERGFPVEE